MVCILSSAYLAMASISVSISGLMSLALMTGRCSRTSVIKLHKLIIIQT